MKRLIISAILVIALLLTALAVQAQDAGIPITYGESVVGTISNEAPEVTYTFEGSEGDVIVAEMGALDPFGDLSSVLLRLVGPDGAMIGELDSFATVVFASQLPTSGSYTLVATRYDETSFGDFSLRLVLPELLKPGASVDGEVSSEVNTYYVFSGEEPFSLTFTQNSGDFRPQLSVNSIGSSLYTNGLNEIAYLQGSLLTSGTLNITPNAAVASGPYIISFSEALFDFNFDLVTAQFTLTVK
jgi:hypothetical protein